MRYTLGNPVHLHHAHPTLAPPPSLRQIMDRLVDYAFVAPPGPADNDGGVSSPALNAYDAGDYFVIEAQVPGMKPEDIDVSIEQGMLTIQGKTQAEPGTRGAHLPQPRVSARRLQPERTVARDRRL